MASLKAKPKPHQGDQLRQQVWDACRAVGKDRTRFTAADLRPHLPAGTRMDSVRGYVKGLVGAKFIAVEPRDRPGQPNHYTVIKQHHGEAPCVTREGEPAKHGLAIEALWRTLRTMRGTFTPETLAVLASTDEVQIKPERARSYLNDLAKTQIIRKDGDKYSFVEAFNPGPRAPLVQSVKRVFDPNSWKVLWSSDEVSHG